jgi:hypothetical protein
MSLSYQSSRPKRLEASKVSGAVQEYGRSREKRTRPQSLRGREVLWEPKADVMVG